MSDSGLSIFDDDEPDTGDTDAPRTTGPATETEDPPSPRTRVSTRSPTTPRPPR